MTGEKNKKSAFIDWINDGIAFISSLTENWLLFQLMAYNHRQHGALL